MGTSFQVKEQIEEKLGQVLEARDALLPQLPHNWILGPLDVCWLQKRTVTYFTTGTTTSYYHWVLGRDVSTGAAIAAYLAQHDRTQDGGGWFTSPTEMRLEKAVYCCFDPFSKLDVRCELTIPGKAEFFGLDPETEEKHPVTTTMWQQMQVGAFLRSELYPPVSMCLERHDRNITPDQEVHLLGAIHALYTSGVLPDASMELHFDPGLGCSVDQCDLVLATVLHFFARRQRWHAAAIFFSQLIGATPVAAICLCRCQQHLEEEEAVLPTLHAAWERYPDDPLLLVAMGEFHLHDQALELAASCAKKALSLISDFRPAWLILAHCYVRSGQHELALAALNSCPPPGLVQDDDTSLEMVVPETVATTVPACPAYDPDRQQQLQVMQEDKGAVSRGLKYLPAAMMLNREPPGQGLEPDVAPMRCNKAVVGVVYTLLQMIVDAVGWDEFLQVRSRVFAMYGEELLSPTATGTPALSPLNLDVLSNDNGVIDLSAATSTDSPSGMVPQLYHTIFGAHKGTAAQPKGKGKGRGLSTMEWDRAMLMGPDPGVEDMGKRLCVRWLDDLILALWHDLQAYMDWSVRDRKVRQFKGQTHAGLIMGLPPTEDSEAVDVVLPLLSPQDWVRRGMLAERLQHEEDAWQAYRAAAVLSPTNMSALSAVVRLGVNRMDVEVALHAMSALCGVHDALALSEQRKVLPLAVSLGMEALVGEFGVEGVRLKVEEQQGHPVLLELLQRA